MSKGFLLAFIVKAREVLDHVVQCTSSDAWCHLHIIISSLPLKPISYMIDVNVWIEGLLLILVFVKHGSVLESGRMRCLALRMVLLQSFQHVVGLLAHHGSALGAQGFVIVISHSDRLVQWLVGARRLRSSLLLHPVWM